MGHPYIEKVPFTYRFTHAMAIACTSGYIPVRRYQVTTTKHGSHCAVSFISALAIYRIGTSNPNRRGHIEISIVLCGRASGKTRPNDVTESIVLSSSVRARGEHPDVSRNHPTTILLRSRFGLQRTSLVATAVVRCVLLVFFFTTLRGSKDFPV